MFDIIVISCLLIIIIILVFNLKDITKYEKNLESNMDRIKNEIKRELQLEMCKAVNQDIEL